MPKKMLIDATHAEETRVVVVDGNKVEEFDFESENKRQLAGNIYLAKVTRVEPSLQAAFVDYGGNRHGFLAFSEIHPDYYQIPVADREALLAEEAELARAEAEEDEDEKPKRRSRSRGGRSRSRSKAAETSNDDAVETKDVESAIPGMDVVEPVGEGDEPLLAEDEAVSPMERVAETPVEEPDDEEPEAQDASEDADSGEGGQDRGHDDAPYVAADTAAERDDTIESVAEEDVTEEIRRPRKPRARKYKIQEVIKVRQILLVQVVKEERGNKGAALTTYLSLAGRYCVLMPNTARGGGISRKITNAADRKKLKEIASEIDVPKGAGLIVRTAGAKRTKTEIKRDYEYLQRMWEQIRELTLKSIAPAKIYEEGNLIKRSIRDLYSREIDEVIVEGEAGYRTAKDFMKMIMPSHAKNVKAYTDPMPLFARYQVESYLGGMFNPVVQLKSGGYIVIGVTEALVAIDVNSGRATKEGSIEDTALKTNLEAAEEVARQLRLRDLAGLIVIDFIDMEERKNNAAVEKRFKDKLKTDRARIQVGRISGFGLLEMSRQRLRPGMIEVTTQACPACHGTGLVRSDDSLGLTILRQIEEEGTRRRSREVLVKAPVAIVNFLMNHKREHIAGIEARYGMSVRIEADPFLISPDFSLEKFKTATRPVQEAAPVVSVDASLMEEIDEEVAEEDEATDGVDAEVESDQPPKKKRRRRRRRRSGSGQRDETEARETDAAEADAPAKDNDAAADEAEAPEPAEAEQAEEKPKKRSRSRSRKKADPATEEAQAEGAVAEEVPADSAEPAAETEAEEKPKPKRSRSRKKKEPEAEASAAETEQTPEQAPEPTAEPTPDPEPEAEPQLETAGAGAEDASAADDGDKPKRRGWWNLGR
ncbi:Rne/Rng family ribonuclease [Ovoidimarina sediminis]|uniref:Rne/Rng family ribonuclease n=1 Tax=Ovoidimarina sediminis TaxID=3079856 RepID=UPI0029133D6A|nr:Rne/Rng family ribonuclease [Rhodophyticola sp. MJ-SS7]MDU8944864.1 Rne/Rng family ribonuclease [Rhodophyticola sp. MJ-SS7]